MGADGRSGRYGRGKCYHRTVIKSPSCCLQMIDNPCRRPLIHRDTLAAALAIYQGLGSLQYTSKASLTHFSELHGNEDGTIPATFQIIYMVCNVHFSAIVIESELYIDRLEAVIKPASAARSGHWKGQPERSLVGCIPLTRKIHYVGLELHILVGNNRLSQGDMTHLDFSVFCSRPQIILLDIRSDIQPRS